MVTFRFIIGLAVLVLLVTFALQNLEPSVTFQYFGFKYGPIPFFFALLASAVAGMMIAMIFSIFEQFRLRAIIRRQQRQATSMKKEIHEYELLMPEQLIEKNLAQVSNNDK
jgi:uncharacterized integral membrane protein